MTNPALGSDAMRASDLQPIGAGLVGAVTGFASSFALVVAGLQAVGASPADTASGLLMLCVLQGVLAIGLDSMLARYAQDVGNARLQAEALAGLERTLVD